LRKPLLSFCLCLLLVAAASADSLHVRLVGTWPYAGSAALGVAVKGEHVYIVSDNFHVISVADPAQPVEVGRCSTSGRGLAASGDYAYVASPDSALIVVSVADPTHPVPVGRCSTAGLSAAAVSGEYTYVVGDDWGLDVISVADPTHPEKVGHCGGPWTWKGYHVRVVGHYAYVASADSGLAIVSVASPESAEAT